MVKERHIAEVAFAAPTGTPTGVEVMSLADLRSRAPAGVLQVPARPEFHQLLTVTSGALVHDVEDGRRPMSIETFRALTAPEAAP